MIRKLTAVLVVCGAAFLGFVIGAVIVTIIDLYLSGHGVTPLGSRPLLSSDTSGTHLSVADALAFVPSIGGVILAVVALRGRRPEPRDRVGRLS